MPRLYHPVLDRHIDVPSEASARVHRASGWQDADSAPLPGDGQVADEVGDTNDLDEEGD